MKKLFFLLVICCIANTSSYGQQFAEIGAFVGFANYQGDLSQDPIEFGATKYSLGGFVRYHYSTNLYFKGSVYVGKISGSDSNADPNSSVFRRNWSTETNLVDVSINAEWLPFAKPRFNKVSVFRPQINPYIHAGIGLNFMQPDRINFNGNDPSNYQNTIIEQKTNFIVVPIGAGLRFDFTQWTTLAFEYAWRFPNSDFIDGISANGKDNSDWYFFVGATFSTFFGEQENFGL